MSDSDEPRDVVVLTRLTELPVARLLCGRLMAEGIETFLPDEHRERHILQWRGPVGGFRIQVRQADVERAKEILEQPTPEPAAGEEADEDTISAGDRRAFRALRVALVTLLLPGLIHPYSLWLAAQSLRSTDITAFGRWRAWVALSVSLLGCACLGLFVYWLARVH